MAKAGLKFPAVLLLQSKGYLEMCVREICHSTGDIMAQISNKPGLLSDLQCRGKLPTMKLSQSASSIPIEKQTCSRTCLGICSLKSLTTSRNSSKSSQISVGITVDKTSILL